MKAQIQKTINSKLETYDLTKDQLSVTELVFHGLSNKEIGNILQITEKGVKWHLTNVYKKAQVSNRVNLILNCLGDY